MNRKKTMAIVLAALLLLSGGAWLFLAGPGADAAAKMRCSMMGGEYGTLYQDGFNTGKNACRAKLPPKPESTGCFTSADCGKDGECVFGDMVIGGRTPSGWCTGRILF